jgi:hypothetical protein
LPLPPPPRRAATPLPRIRRRRRRQLHAFFFSHYCHAAAAFHISIADASMIFLRYLAAKMPFSFFAVAISDDAARP